VFVALSVTAAALWAFAKSEQQVWSNINKSGKMLIHFGRFIGASP